MHHTPASTRAVPEPVRWIARHLCAARRDALFHDHAGTRRGEPRRRGVFQRSGAPGYQWFP